MKVDLEFDRRNGRITPTKDGRFFRFALIFKDDDGGHLLEIKGLRVNQAINHLYPPMNTNGFTVVDLSPDFSKRLLEQASAYLKGQGVNAA